MVLASQALAVFLHGAAKFLETTNGGMEPLQVLNFRMVVTVSGSSLILWARKERDIPLGPRELRVLFIVRAVGGICGSIGFYCMNISRRRLLLSTNQMADDDFRLPCISPIG
jgi:hypothetical protein